MICKKCNQPKSGRGCKNCTKLRQQKWYQNNKEKTKQRSKKTYLNNREVLLVQRKEYNCKYRNRRNELDRQRRLIDPAYRLRRNFTSRISMALKGRKNYLSMLEYLPYTMDELKNHLESKFDDKMSWENYGIYWHIDHIYPQSKLPYTSMNDENFQKCWALNNLRPLEAAANRAKRDKIVSDQ